MKVLIAIDSFKGSMSSKDAGMAAMEGIKKVYTDSEIFIRPIADGGEGTVEALVEGLNGRIKTVEVKNPLGKTIKAQYGIINDNTAVIEMSAAAGIFLIKNEELNPMHTTTYGVGELIKDAIYEGCRNFIIGIGGSATNDAGVGMLQALGYEMLDKDGKNVPYGAMGVGLIESIKDDNVIQKLKECNFKIACDVKNPLCGEMGASYIFSPQKGAKKEDIAVMDESLLRFAKITKEKYPNADENYPGTGAAGGLGFAFLAYLNGKLKSGIDLILEETNFSEYAKKADIVVTGEGRIDKQTIMGKVPFGVAKASKKYGKPVIAFAGALTDDASVCNEHGIDALFSITPSACSLDEAMKRENAMKNMTNTVEQVFRVIKMR